jgi:hypothetical protein
MTDINLENHIQIQNNINDLESIKEEEINQNRNTAMSNPNVNFSAYKMSPMESRD